MSDEQGVEPSGTTRRRFVQAAAAAGAIGVVWSEPIIRGTAASAADGVSVNGKCTGAFIAWSNNADKWMASPMSSFSNADSTTDNGKTTGDTPPPTATYTWNAMNATVCPTLTANVTVTATDSPELSTGATVQITSGVSCMFANIVSSVQGGGSPGGTITVVDSVTFTWSNALAAGNNPQVTFDIVC